MTHCTSQRRIRTCIAVSIFVFALSFFSPCALADNDNLNSGGLGIAIPAGDVDISTSIPQAPLTETVISIVNYFLGFLGFVAVIFIIYAGILLVVSAGNDEATGKAKKIITYAGAGFIVIMLSYSAVTFIAGSAGGGRQEDVPLGADGRDGRDGDSGFSSLVSVLPISPPNSYCPSGGQQVGTGLDRNRNGILDPDEMASFYVCNGAGGADGSDGRDSGVSEGSATGGSGSQASGRDGTSALVKVSKEPSGRNCRNGGQRIDFGMDDNGNGSLSAGETDNSSFVCNGEQGVAGSPGGIKSALCGGRECLQGQCVNNVCRAPVAPPKPVRSCQSHADCSPNEECRSGRCASLAGGGEVSEPGPMAAQENLDRIDRRFLDLERNLNADSFDGAEKEKINGALDGDNLDDKISALETLIRDSSTSPEFAEKLDFFLSGLQSLKMIREEMERLRENMPESGATLKSYQEASEALDKLIGNPTDKILLRRFQSRYKDLKDLISAFPVVQARIRSIPATGSAPLEVQLDGLSSADPTGGTISDYRWTMTGPDGTDILLGSGSVITYQFDEANTYAVKLRVSTSSKDAEGYKIAADGISILRIRVTPPLADVRFRINGVEAYDLFHVTLREGQSGLSMDPSASLPAMGRTLVKYEWSFGDGQGEVRQAPTTVVHSYQKPGEYFIKLEATDNLGIKDKRLVKLFVKSLAADIRIRPPSGNVNTEFNFEGLRSRSDDGVILGFDWEIQDREGQAVAESEQSSFHHVFSKPGFYKIVLSVTDVTKSSDKVVKDLEVESRPPVAGFSFETPDRNHPNRFVFSAIDSYDPDEGDRIAYSWDFNGDGNFEVVKSREPQVTYDYKNKGSYKARLQAEDSFGLQKSSEKEITVPSTLSADLTTDWRIARVGSPVTFRATGSNAAAYLWEFGDGETQSTENPTVTHTYNKAGKMMAKMNFFDKEDNQNYDQKKVLVGQGDRPIAVIDALLNSRSLFWMENLCGPGREGAFVTRADLIRFDARYSINTDGSGRLLIYDWSLPDGTHNASKEFNFRFDEISREGECFSVGLTSRDQISGKLSDQAEIYFKVVNQPPQVTDFVILPPAAADSFVTPVKIRLKAVNPKDADGSIKKYRWWYSREGFENERFGLHSTSTPETDMTVTSVGEPDVVNRYYFDMEILDSDNGVFRAAERFGETSFVDIRNGHNLSPVAGFTMDKSTVTVGDSVMFFSTSYDPQGETFPNDAFRWDFDGDGAFDDITTGHQVSRQFNTPGEYDVRLKVVHRGLSSSASGKVSVEAAHTLPQAAFTFRTEGTTVFFDASGTRYDSALADSSIRFEWDFNIQEDANGNGVKDDDIQSSDVQTFYSYTPGKYRIKLKARDSLGMEGVVVREIDLTQSEAERQKNSFKSLKVGSLNKPITTLEVEIVPVTMEKGGSADVLATVMNADGTPYSGKIYFEIVNGSGEFTPNPVEAKNSTASSVFLSGDSGKVQIRVRATDTSYGELTEEATINVR